MQDNIARIILDTNVLLNGLFVPYSYSRKVLEYINSGKIIAYISENTLAEAQKKLREIEKEIGIDLSGQFMLFIKNFSYFILPRITRNEAKKYKFIKGIEDKSLTALAVKTGLEICTNDVNDFRNSNRYGVVVKTPKDMCSDGTAKLEDIFTGNLASPFEGTYYLAASSYWLDLCGKSSNRKLYGIYDTPGIGGLYLDSASTSFKFIIDNGPSVSLKIKGISTGETSTKIVVTYKCTEGVQIYHGYRGGRAIQKVTWTPEKPPLNVSTKYCQGRLGNFDAPMHIALFSSFHKIVTEKEANNLMGNKIPSYPWERIGLVEALRLLQ